MSPDWRRRAETRRFSAALAASAAAHLALGALPAPERPAGGARPPRPLEARLEAGRAPRATLGPALAAPAPGEGPWVRPEADAHPRAARAAARAAPPRRSPVALAPAEDPTHYSAHELDVYPRLLAPLALPDAEPGGAGAERLLLVVLIDERGAVTRVNAAEPAPAQAEQAARAALLAARFAPAIKDGRAVKSRLVLSVRFAPAGEH